MPAEKEISKKIIRVVKAGDKLVQDVQRDMAQLMAAASGVKEIISDIKDKFKPKQAD